MNHDRVNRDLNELIRRIVGIDSSTSTLQTFSNEILNQSTPTSTFNHSKIPFSLLSQQISNYLRDLHSSPQAPQTLNNLLSRLDPLPHPREKSNAIQFLYALANPTPTRSQSIQPLPTIESHQDQTTKPHSKSSISSTSNIPIPIPIPNQDSKDQKPSLSSKLKAKRAQHGYPSHLPEQLLLRDLVYLLQAIDGKYLSFEDKREEAEEDHLADQSWSDHGIRFHEPPSQIITLPQRDLILKLAEIGWLYKRIRLAIEPMLPTNDHLTKKTALGDSSAGMVAQALIYSLQAELGTYYRVIALLESNLHSFTLKSLFLHLNPTLLRLRMCAALLGASENIRGGKLISILDSYTQHGDPIVSRFVSDLLETVSGPFFEFLRSWIWDGELLDRFEEFFIGVNEPNPHHDQDDQDSINRNESWKVWESKFVFREEFVPSFINPIFAKKIYSTGKSINFIKYSCSEQDWQRTRAELHKLSSSSSLHYQDIEGLEETIKSAYKICSKELFYIFFTKLKLLDHLKALKDFLLLGRGDFISLLIESLGPSLNKPASSLYRHNLTATLESAIRATSDDQALMNRLDVRMLEFTPLDLGWDVFMLEYKPQSPLEVVLSPAAMGGYMKTFRMLWRMKRVEYALDGGWKAVMLGSKSERFKSDFHRARLVMSEMIHFIRQLQCYVQLEVIECGWQEFEKRVMLEGGDLDSLVEAHGVYLDRLVSKGMLLNPKAGKENTCLLLAEECFKVILAYKASIDSLKAYVLSDRSESDPGNSARSTPVQGSMPALDEIRRLIAAQARLFNEVVLDLISALTAQPDPDLRFLSVRLNFSLFYLRPKSLGGSTKQQNNRR
ncbi:Spc98 family-domain-containing protein [Melampsora americana]|nr:Spc98 family-domain-containing protein [Melampsora americana]